MRRAPKVSTVEWNLLLGGLVLLVAAVVAAFAAEDAGGARRVAGVAGLAVLGLCAVARAVRVYRTGTAATLPASVGRTAVEIRPARAFGAATVAAALGLPLVTAAVLVALIDWAWLPVAGVAMAGFACVTVNRRPASVWDSYRYPRDAEVPGELLQRLCMRADMAVPELVVEPAVVANAWTAGGRIHVTIPLLDLLDRAELEAVLAHEVAHLARRDAAVMEICSAPYRALLAFAAAVPRMPRWAGLSTPAIGLWIAAALCVPPALVVGWLSRLSVLGSSRARELAADAAAAALTGRPSALASALLKLEGGEAPRTDLREVAVLCIVDPARSELGRLLSTHPSTRARVERLEALEARLP